MRTTQKCGHSPRSAGLGWPSWGPTGRQQTPPPGPQSRPFPDTCGPLGGLCGGQSREAGFSKGLRGSWPFVCMNYRCPPPQVAGHGSPSGAPHWSEPSGLSALVSTRELPTPSSPPGIVCPGLRLGFHSAQNKGGGRGAGDRTLIPQRVCAEQEGPRGWQAGTGG